MIDRIPLDEMTDEQLDALYDERDYYATAYRKLLEHFGAERAGRLRAGEQQAEGYVVGHAIIGIHVEAAEGPDLEQQLPH